MLSRKIRNQFLTYFQEHSHVIVPSSSLVPHHDDSLLFNNAGMNQFKDRFSGKEEKGYRRATSSQKCLRAGGKHNDLNNVGHTPYHLTFFEMLGNFSFGDYFKEEAIRYAWEVSTRIFQFNPDDIWVSIFQEDNEAFELWTTWLPEERIVRMGRESNWWSMGESGPCGPCSELLYDRGPQFGSANTPSMDSSGERFLEFWNLVFMEYHLDRGGKLTPLPQKSIDTGAGLERVLSLMMKVPTVFQVDPFTTLILHIEEIVQKSYRSDVKEEASPFHVIADHIRSLVFAIGEGVQPSNVERGYILRKILRRAVHYGRRLGIHTPFLGKVAVVFIDLMKQDYPEIAAAQSKILDTLQREEEGFLHTLKRGGHLLGSIIQKATQTPSKQISASDAFRLKDTYGFPLEELLLLAQDYHLGIDLQEYSVLEAKARERSKGSHKESKEKIPIDLFAHLVQRYPPSTFVGYDQKEAECQVIGIIVNHTLVDHIHEGEKGTIILDRTPFYGEKGGQVGDIGLCVRGQNLFRVEDTQLPHQGIIAHLGQMETGSLHVGEQLCAQIDLSYREKISKRHTATHLLHWALRGTLGPQAVQSGSLVSSRYLRFDFIHDRAMSREEVEEIERKVNQAIWDNLPVSVEILGREEVKEREEITQLFKEKYKEKVRLILIGSLSKELCGGTHVDRTGKIGCFRILHEKSIAKNTRRIEGVTGMEAERVRWQQERQVECMAKLLKVSKGQVETGLSHLFQKFSELEEQLCVQKQKYLRQLASHLTLEVKSVGTIQLLMAEVQIGGDELSDLANLLLQNMDRAILFLIAREEGEDTSFRFMLRFSPCLVEQGLDANQWIKVLANILGGSGGGRKESAQGGGHIPTAIPSAFRDLQDKVRKIDNSFPSSFFDEGKS